MSVALRWAVLGLATLVSAGGASRRATLDAARWTAAPADGVEMRLTNDAAEGGALRLDFDFHGHGGWAAARLPWEVELPAPPGGWELRFRLRGEGPPNHLEVKFVAGDDVWWSVRRDLEWPRAWTPMKVRKRQVRFAWGPAGGGDLARFVALELAVTAGAGGRGTVWISDLEIVPVAAQRTAPAPRAHAAVETRDHPASAALDGDPATAWRAASGGDWLVDLGVPRELGGVTLRWEPGEQPRRFLLESSDDGVRFTKIYEATRAGGGRNDLFLPDTETRWLRLRVPRGEGAAGLAELEIRPLELGASENAFFLALAKEARRGDYPRGFSGEQVYWTVAGVDGAAEESLVSEDGAAELGELAPSLEPFVALDGELATWAEARVSQRLEEGDLPIPGVVWELPDLRLETTVLAVPAVGASSFLAIRYRLTNLAAATRRATLFAAARPFQVNPPSQFLNLAGGVARLARAGCSAEGLELDGRSVFVSPPADRCGASAFEEGPLVDGLRRGAFPASAAVADPFGRASAVLAWELTLSPGAAREVVVAAPFTPAAREAARALARADAASRYADLLASESTAWREKLGRVELRVPAGAAPLVATLHSALAAVLIHRDGPAVQPGSRAYARSWIRDGALTGEALLRLGYAEEVRAFADWYAGSLYPDGKVPCCVDRRGADPVPENDSHGEWIHLVREVFRYTGDRAFAGRHFPSVERTVAYLDALRAKRRTPEFAAGEKRIFYGLLPESISHEGYSAKPMHSYWDDAFAFRGYDDAVALAAALGRDDLAARWAAARDELRRDLLASLALVAERHGIDSLPGCAELGDFDPTSTTILLEPGGLGADLPAGAVAATFDRYWRESMERRDGRRAWDAYTPYELRTVGTFVRLGQRERAHELLDFFLAGRRPAAWNLWAEVVGRELREPRFLGDLPHGWVASDYARSLLDLFAYERREDGALVLAAGIPGRWIETGEAVGVRDLRTPWGPLSFTLRRQGSVLAVSVAPLAADPPGGVWLDLPPGEKPRRITLPAELEVPWP